MEIVEMWMRYFIEFHANHSMFVSVKGFVCPPNELYSSD